jgi:hypothetical protein
LAGGGVAEEEAGVAEVVSVGEDVGFDVEGFSGGAFGGEAAGVDFRGDGFDDGAGATEGGLGGMAMDGEARGGGRDGVRRGGDRLPVDSGDREVGMEVGMEAGMGVGGGHRCRGC